MSNDKKNLLILETAAIELCSLVMLSIELIFDIPFPISDIFVQKSSKIALKFILKIDLLDKPKYHLKVTRL
jgi:hypothetical protein